jgi:hypothetical protein
MKLCGFEKTRNELCIFSKYANWNCVHKPRSETVCIHQGCEWNSAFSPVTCKGINLGLKHKFLLSHFRENLHTKINENFSEISRKFSWILAKVYAKILYAKPAISVKWGTFWKSFLISTAVTIAVLRSSPAVLSRMPYPNYPVSAVTGCPYMAGCQN